MRNRNSRLLKDSIKLIMDVIIVKKIGGEDVLIYYCCFIMLPKNSRFKQHKLIIL